jgi:hypothetical protein
VLTEPCPVLRGQRGDQVELDDLLRDPVEVKKISADLDGQSLVLRVNPDSRARSGTKSARCSRS